MDRRKFFRFMARSAGAALACGAPRICGAEEEPGSAAAARAYLRSIMPTHERAIRFTEVMTPDESRRRSNGWTYDANLGWVHCSAVHTNGERRPLRSGKTS